MEFPIYDEDEANDRFEVQKLIDTGNGWKFEGSVGRHMMEYIEAGICVLGHVATRDYYGNFVPARFMAEAGKLGSLEYARERQPDMWPSDEELTPLIPAYLAKNPYAKYGGSATARFSISIALDVWIEQQNGCTSMCPVDRTVTCDNHNEGDVNGNVHGTKSGMRWNNA